jgi:hypothetical protein
MAQAREAVARHYAILERELAGLVGAACAAPERTRH